MRKNKTVYMVQHSPYRWTLETTDGKIIQDDVLQPHYYAAEQYVKAYISSFMTYTYVMVPLKDKKND